MHLQQAHNKTKKYKEKATDIRCQEDDKRCENAAIKQPYTAQHQGISMHMKHRHDIGMKK